LNANHSVKQTQAEREQTMADHSHDHSGLNRRSVLKAGASLGAAATLGDALAAQSPALTADMAKSVESWLVMLSDTQRRAGQLPWGEARENWHYVPRSRPGLPLREMNDQQKQAVWDVLGALLSARGLDHVRGALILEKILGEMTGRPDFRDPGNYALVVFGNPAATDPWAWRMEGHHLSLTVVIAPGIGLSVTPAFFGANPATVPEGHDHAGFRLFGAEEDAAFGLIRSLEGEARQSAIIGDRSLGDIVAGPGRETVLQDYEGVSLERLNEAQRGGIMRIAQLFARTMREEIANAAMDRLHAAGAGAIHFAWAGSLERGSPHYFRIHAPTALIEYDNTQNGANHVHTVWIDPQNVFGRDMLKTHYHHDH
jgi:hypothetical protein